MRLIFLTTFAPMKVNIFTADGSDLKLARRRHIYTLLVATVVCYLVWSIDYFNINTVFQDLLASAIETIVLMELSLVACRTIIKVFWKSGHSFTSILLQNLLLLISVITISAMVSWLSSMLISDEAGLFNDTFTWDSLIVYFLTSVFFTSYLTNRYWKEATIALQMSVDKLKLKTDNHFVFNSLATLENLIATDPDKATEFNHSISRMYRYIVSKGDSRVVPLSEEIEFAKEYSRNISFRYDNVTIDFDDNLNKISYVIPPLSIQGLIENALKHNIHCKDKPLSIHIKLTQGFIEVSNNIQSLSRQLNSPHTGLDTLHDRFRLISRKEIVVKNNGETFIVRLPLLTKSEVDENTDY